MLKQLLYKNSKKATAVGQDRSVTLVHRVMCVTNNHETKKQLAAAANSNQKKNDQICLQIEVVWKLLTLRT